VWELASSSNFEVAITIIITLNVLTMAMEHHDQSPEFTFILALFNYTFTLVFTVEMLVKLVAFQTRRYFSDGWNRFDFFVVLVSYLGILMDVLDSTSPVNPSILRIMRVFRIVRILKLLKTAQGVRALLHCVFQSLGQITNMCVLLGLYFCIYAAAGVELFGRLGCVHSGCDGLSVHANFENFGQALLTLFRICTGDNGNGILRDAMREAPDCDDSESCEQDCCASKILAPVYFVSFTVVAQFVLLNVVVAVLMAQLEESQAQNDDSFQREVKIEEQARAEGREVLRSDSVQALVKLREGRLQKPRSEVDKNQRAEERARRAREGGEDISDEEDEVLEALAKVHSVEDLQMELGLVAASSGDLTSVAPESERGVDRSQDKL